MYRMLVIRHKKPYTRWSWLHRSHDTTWLS